MRGGGGGLGREIVQSLSLLALVAGVMSFYVGLGLLAVWALA
jgi:hypothetical protein